MHTTDVPLAPEERLREVAAILAAGLLRLRTRPQLAATSDMSGEHDLSERARARAAELANDADIRMTPPRRTAKPDGQSVAVGMLCVSADKRLPMPGTMLSRQYKGRTVIVTILPNGFEYEGKVYPTALPQPAE